jgi:sulfatase modifying factor 1
MLTVGSYKIDTTEVTNGAYAQFLASNPCVGDQPAECAFNGSFTPPNAWPAFGKDDFPVAYVNWCDAYAYCKWAGKHLCGEIGGGELAFGNYANPTKDEWFAACSGGQNLKYPYGASYDAAVCNGLDTWGGDPIVAKSMPAGSESACVGGYPGLYDMSGNLWEWENSCSGKVGETDTCHARGGSFWSTGNVMRCNFSSDRNRSNVARNIGFRCCAD